jgi:hypothetical protein
MITVAELNRRVKRLNVETTSEESIDQTKEDYKTSQRDQMLHGLKADGSKIGKYRSPAYARRKYAMNPLAGFGNMDWRLTGSLHKEIFVNADNGLIVTGSADEKFNKLAEAFGDPLGLGGEYKEKYLQVLTPVFVNKVKEIIKL